MAVKPTAKKSPGRPKKTEPSIQGEKEQTKTKNEEVASMVDMAEEYIKKEMAEGKELKDISEVQFDPKKIEEAIKNVDTTIKSDGGLEEIMTMITDELKPIQKITDDMSKMNAKAAVLSAEMEKNPEKAAELAQKELDKITQMKENVEKMLANSKITNNKSMHGPTSWWNGMGVL